jgi:3D (Asp-Asp-Asp) domain-containing protein
MTKVYKKKKAVNKIKAFFKRLSINALAFAGFLIIANAGIEKLKTLDIVKMLEPETITIEAQPVKAQEPQEATKEEEKATEPEKESREVNATTYNAEIAQTDADPYTMANGERVNEQAVASNCYPLGTKLEIEGKTYKVSDRMNKRYTPLCGTKKEKIDLFKWDKKDNFSKRLTIKIL